MDEVKRCWKIISFCIGMISETEEAEQNLKYKSIIEYGLANQDRSIRIVQYITVCNLSDKKDRGMM